MDQPKVVIIIGAARSGTNMLRDILSQIPDCGTWDCDEINPIWCHGNLNHPNDVFEASMASPAIGKFITSEFKKIARSQKVKFVIEKSCANSLRLPFINKIFPQARYIYIHRDGRDTVASAKKRWNASFDLQYTLKKVKYVPLMDIPYYALKFGKTRFKQLMSKDKTLGFWGVRLPDMQTLLENNSLEEVCAHQWNTCVERSNEFFTQPENQNKVITINYQEFVEQPASQLKEILNFMNVPLPEEQEITKLVSGVRQSSLGKYKKELTESEIKQVEKIMKPGLRALQYNI